MKKLEIKQMEKIQGGDTLDGACAVFGFTAAGIAARATLLAIPLWGEAVFAAGTVACLGRRIKLW
ncbi:hypothetical protein [Capnocytophaga sputigena]|jgi:hypothetical protein|uniref:hypothetical protein n=1 Tax=Capnocytophaga sputigena TaxID=1019 RepID=UPI000BB1979A|nr:hypothetical protein [Capnocytophaga sputigena]ATA70345.1 hypothetical protein CGC57_05230 [Capnocytophaga sputigena]VEI53775.1 Uncharacterised protein [Capnocytophaga sputigena]